MFDLNEFRKTAEMFNPMAEGDRAEFDAEVRQAEKEREFEQMMERAGAQALHRKTLTGNVELTIDQKQLLVKYGFAVWTEGDETEYGKFELRK